MGVLVDVKSESSFVLQREDFARALRGLRKFAKDMPGHLDDAQAVAKAKTLADALELAMWKPWFDAFGDLVGLEYQVDKAPHDAGDFWPVPMLEVLAKAGARGRIRYCADEYECAYDLDEDGVYRLDIASAYALKVIDQTPERAAPGETVVVTVKAGEHIADAPLTVKVHCDWAIDGKSKDISAVFEPEPMREGEVRAIAFELSAGARGNVDLVIQAGEGYDYWSFGIEPSAEEIANPWTIVERRSVADRTAVVPKAAIKKTLERLRRFAVRNCERPGAGFLRAVGEASDLDAALAAAGLVLRAADGRQQELVFVGERLPGGEIYFTRLLDLLAKPAGRHCGISLSLAFAEAPRLWREYRVWHGGIRCSVQPRAV